MPPSEMESMDGLRVVISADGKDAILGKVVTSGPFENGMANLGWFLTEDYALERITRKIGEIGFENVVSGKPSYWFVAG